MKISFFEDSYHSEIKAPITQQDSHRSHHIGDIAFYCFEVNLAFKIMIISY